MINGNWTLNNCIESVVSNRFYIYIFVLVRTSLYLLAFLTLIIYINYILIIFVINISSSSFVTKVTFVIWKRMNSKGSEGTTEHTLTQRRLDQ